MNEGKKAKNETRDSLGNKTHELKKKSHRRHNEIERIAEVGRNIPQ